MIDLRLILKLDAVITGVNGLAYLLLADPLQDLLGLSPDLTRPIGAFLVVFAAAVWLVAARPARPAVLMVVAANGAWALGSLLFAATGASSPTSVGTVWVVLQALVVGAFAALQALASRPASSAVRPSPNSSAISS